jgi:hypothetical protein
MKTISKVMDSPYFWFSVAVVGMGVAVAAAAIKSTIR